MMMMSLSLIPFIQGLRKECSTKKLKTKNLISKQTRTQFYSNELILDLVFSPFKLVEKIAK